MRRGIAKPRTICCLFSLALWETDYQINLFADGINTSWASERAVHKPHMTQLELLKSKRCIQPTLFAASEIFPVLSLGRILLDSF